ncbi:hypothetical protein EJ05DRAFT_474025 [Pseudovirgaria hyperparasitica]|uniref:Uncharacterized protein n=1 Tax=Pseudovirgaria hyperparasitica TaxID=470096 RepID=A0A6A6WEV9_9PEZI|nr:uncharacterized protein EJ05DRAFT_474025 [Pseudovirgaria hyperparasitica]KAF2760117.1 hypothetical protein EJ05DRAFT_474025 [Pseudovirgaria hyperparasitica]
MHLLNILVITIIGITTNIVVAETKCRPPNWLERTANKGLDNVYKHTDASFIHGVIDSLQAVPLDEYQACPDQMIEHFRPGEEKRYTIPDDILPPELKGGFVVCRENGTPLNYQDIQAIEELQMEACEGKDNKWGKHVGGQRKDYPHGDGVAFQCDYTPRFHSHTVQTCDPKSLAEMLLLVNRYCMDYPGWFSMEAWDVTYGRQHKEALKRC